MVSLLPSIAVTLPLPNFWWKTRSPRVKAETVPVDLATSSPSMVSGRRREPLDASRLRHGEGYELSSPALVSERCRPSPDRASLDRPLPERERGNGSSSAA
jgi:hypothetical protein